MLVNATLADDGRLRIHMSEVNMRTTKAFTHGSIVLDTNSLTIKDFSIPMPAGIKLADGMKIDMQLVAPDGEDRKQTRTIEIKARRDDPGVFFAKGLSKTPSVYSKDDGWGVKMFPFRAYFTHPGVVTDGGLPDWIKASVKRQNEYWNSLAWHCREARRACSNVSEETLKAFIAESILPAIDAFNNLLGRSKEKIKHPRKLKVDHPTMSGIYSLMGSLKKRVEEGLPVPEGLLEELESFTADHKADYTPLNKFLNGVTDLMDEEAKKLGLSRWESTPVSKAFQSVLKRRKTLNSDFTTGWPLIRYKESPRNANWSIHYNFKKAGVSSSLLETSSGVPGLVFGPVVPPHLAGHVKMVGSASKRKIRQARISIIERERGRQEFTFAILQHRDLPAGSDIKEWKLLYKDNQLWLALVVALKNPIPEKSEVAAGFDIGWRRVGDYIRFGMLYEPNGKTFRELKVNLLQSPPDHADREPFVLALGPNQWERRNMPYLHPTWRPGDKPYNALETRAILSSRRAQIQQSAKNNIRAHFGDSAPIWLDKIGRRGFEKMLVNPETDPAVRAFIAQWKKEDDEFERIVTKRHADKFRTLTEYFKHMTRRIEYGQQLIAHDVCRHLQDAGIAQLNIEEEFMAKVARDQSNMDSDRLKNSQKYRQLVAAAKFVSALRNIAEKYGIVVEEKPAMNTSRICHVCGELNPGTDEVVFLCSKCGAQVDQDKNAAINLSSDSKMPQAEDDDEEEEGVA